VPEPREQFLNGDRLEDWAAREMQAYSISARGKPAYECFASSETADAAKAVFRWLNRRLASGHSGFTEAEASELMRMRDWALHALISHGAKSFAKSAHIEASDGRPLAICIGGGSIIFAPTELGLIRTSTRGCFRVFEEPLNLSGKKWPRLCPDCQKRNGRRNPQRDAVRDAQQRAREHLRALEASAAA
jgi:hypothetical protein